MVVFFVGTPGSGKSYEAVKKIVDNLMLGRTVCTNVDGMNDPKCLEYMKNLVGMDDFTFDQRFRFLDSDQVKRFWKTEKVINLQFMQDEESGVFNDIPTEVDELICPHGSLIVIDEAHKPFNSRDWQNTSNRELADWASTHRHFGYDLVLITQDIEKVEKQVRSLTEWCYFFRKVNFFGGAVKKKYLCYSYSGDDHNGKPLAKSTRTYEDKYFPCYSSYSTSDAKEVGFMSHTNILKHPIFYAIPVVIAFCLYMFFQKSSFASGDVFGVNKVQHKYDKLVSDNKDMKKASAPSQTPLSVPPRNAIMQNLPSQGQNTLATAVNGSPVAALANVSLPEYTEYKIDGYLVNDGKTTLLINGMSVLLPSPYVQKYIKSVGIAIAKTSYFGVKRVSAPSPAPDKHDNPDVVKKPDPDPIPHLLFSNL